MPDQLKQWIFHPTLVKFVIALVGLVIVYALSKAAQRGISRGIEDPSTRYTARKIVAFFGYFLAIVVVATIFSDRLAGLTVALGVAGAWLLDGAATCTGFFFDCTPKGPRMLPNRFTSAPWRRMMMYCWVTESVLFHAQ